MSESYLLTRGSLTTEPIDAAYAAELFASARKDPDADLDGALESGFRFWVTHDGMRSVRWRVTPVEPVEGV